MKTETALVRMTSFVTCALVLVLIGVKGSAFWVSGSVAVLASLMDSIVDALVSLVHFAAILYSTKPADAEHRHGHGKIEGLSALLQAIVMAVVALFVVYEAFHDPMVSRGGEASWFVVGMMVVSLLSSVFIVKMQSHAIDETNSLVIESDRAHYISDLFHHIGVIISLLTVMYFNVMWVDTICAILIAVWMLSASREIGAKGVNMILDRELQDEERKAILGLIHAHPDVMGVHDLRATRSGMMEKIFFDIEADPDMSCRQSHQITRDLEAEILKIYPRAEIMIHVDPHGELEDSRHKEIKDYH